MKYTPKIKQISNPDLGEGVLYLENGRPYRGPYVQDSAGNLYTGGYITETSKPLVVIYPEDGLEFQTQENFVVFYPKLTEDIKNRGYFTRYFLQDPISKRIKEVSKESYQRERREVKTQSFLFYECTWYLSSKLTWRNEKAIEEGEKIMKSIGNQVLKSPLQFVE